MQANTMYLFFREYINPPSITSLPSSQNLLVRLGKSGIAPIVELVKAIFKKRPDNQRNLIFLQVSLKLQVYLTANMFHLFSQLISIKLFQILLYIVYWFIYEQEFMMYEYLLIKFPGFDGQSFSNLIIFRWSTCAVLVGFSWLLNYVMYLNIKKE